MTLPNLLSQRRMKSKKIADSRTVRRGHDCRTIDAKQVDSYTLSGFKEIGVNLFFSPSNVTTTVWHLTSLYYEEEQQSINPLVV